MLSGADPGFLEEGFRCVEEGVRFADFIISHENEMIESQ